MVRRLVAIVPLLLLISFFVFALSFLIPGDPARTLAGGLRAPQARVDEVRHELGLDKPIVVQYWRWLGRAAHGNLGDSLFSHNAVTSEIRHRFPVTFSMALGGLAFMDSSGIQVLIKTAQDLGTNGRLILQSPGELVRRILSLIPMDKLANVEIVDDES